MRAAVRRSLAKSRSLCYNYRQKGTTMSKKDTPESLEELLDSMSVDQVEEKIDIFARQRQEHEKELARTRKKQLPDNEYVIKEEFVLPEEQPPKTAQPAGSEIPRPPVAPPADEPDGGTIVFSSKEIENSLHPGRTKVIKTPPVSEPVREYQPPRERASQPAQPQRVQSARASESVKLQKQKVEKMPESLSSSSTGSTAGSFGTVMKIGGAVMLVALLVVLGFTGWNFIRSSLADTSLLNRQDFEQLLDWAKNYDDLSDEARQKIMEYASIYNRLSDDQKAQINDTLRRLTGKSFDELLAAATSSDKEKPDSSNNNTEIAERKARLREEIAQLQAQIDSLQSTMGEATGRVDQAYDALQSAVDALNSATEDQNTAQQALSDAQDKDKQLSDQIAELNARASDSSLSEAEKAEIERQISDLTTQRTASQQTVQEASSTLEGAKQNYNNALAAYNTAKSTYDSVKGSDSGYADEIAGLQAQISQKKQELEALG